MPIPNLSAYGVPLVSNGARVHASIATLAALLALPANDPSLVHGNEVEVEADQSRWVYNSSSVLTTDSLFVAAPTTSGVLGRWMRKCGLVRLVLPITFATADATVLATLPTGAEACFFTAYWKITTTFAGGSSSAIGVSSNKTGFSTKGDILGGAAGDLTATLVSTGTQNIVAGTIGPKVDTLTETKLVLVAGDTIRFDAITSAYTSGVGSVIVLLQLTQNPGA